MLGYSSGERVFQIQTEYQLVEVIEHPQFGRMLLLDGVPQTSSRYNHYIHESLYLVPYFAHRVMGGVVRVAIIGGGDLFGAALTMQLPVAQVRLFELDAQVLEIAREHLLGDAEKALLDDFRFQVVIGDAYDTFLNESVRVDMAILDLTDPVGETARLYSREFLSEVRRRLPPDGVVGLMAESLEIVSSNSAPDSFYTVLEACLRTFKHVVPYRVWIPPYQEMFCRIVCSDVQMNVPDLRLKTLPIKTRWLTSGLYEAGFKYWSADILDEVERLGLAWW